MPLRIAVLDRDNCSTKKCSMECMNYCPINRMEQECIIMGEKGKPIISEELCVGCGICVHKCPFNAIFIVGLPEALENDLIHQYGVNGFRLFRLPIPKDKMVTGLLGMNGIGKTTVINILSGFIIPNMGELYKKPEWDVVLDKYANTEMAGFLEKVSTGDIKVAMKPQYVDKLAGIYKGKEVGALLRSAGEELIVDELIEELELGLVVNSPLEELSGGELQRAAIAATIAKEADIYFFDEPSSYLDIHQRMKISEVIHKLALKYPVVVIEHDLAVLDFLADNVHLMYGEKGAYGVVAYPRAVRTAINVYLSGYMKEENIRFRSKEIRFEVHPPRKEWNTAPLLHFGDLTKDFGKFKLESGGGVIHMGESIGVVGANATGKTTFVKMLAGVTEPTSGWISGSVRVSYKPQYIRADMSGTVEDLFAIAEIEKCPYYDSELKRPLELDPLIRKDVEKLSGGELQRVAIALALVKQADLYLIDEPSAYLDANQRMEAAKTIRRVMEKSGKSALIVDHDVYFIDLVSDSIMVFTGTPSKHGIGSGPYHLREGMNRFLRDVDVTFRRDPDTSRPRINNRGSGKDREQRGKGEYYYA